MDGKLALVYSIIVAVITLLYIDHEGFVFAKHGTDSPAEAQVEAVDE
jgi:hypothetical protein